MKGEVVHIPNEKKGLPEDVVIGLNEQVIAGVVFVGLFMLRINRNLHLMIENQKKIVQRLTLLTDAVAAMDNDALVIKDVLGLINKTTEETIEKVEEAS